jgi:hypothetical protein
VVKYALKIEEDFMAEPTREDVDLLLRLYEMRREETMRKARKFMIEEFYAENGQEFLAKYPPGSEKNAWFRQATSYWDMVGVFIRKGLLNRDLLFETSAEFHIFWEKARATVQDIRKSRNLPFYMKGLEDLATQHKAFLEERAPGSSAFFGSLNKPPAGAKA